MRVPGVDWISIFVVFNSVFCLVLCFIRINHLFSNLHWILLNGESFIVLWSECWLAVDCFLHNCSRFTLIWILTLWKFPFASIKLQELVGRCAVYSSKWCDLIKQKHKKMPQTSIEPAHVFPKNQNDHVLHMIVRGRTVDATLLLIYLYARLNSIRAQGTHKM